MNSNLIRKKFLDFFIQHQHTAVPSSSLVPNNDPSLLFTNAGMVPFKDAFLGIEKLPWQRVTSSQRCVRAGGKHNDLENVGYTARHHTFFEMLGNFSFGDYFKHDAIRFAWQFLTEELKLPKEKLWITVFEEDDTAFDIWTKEIGVDPNRVSRIGAKDNFWSMGDTGPCGPCSEIFYDHGPDIWGGPPGSPEEDGDRYIEIWNLVFMQYNRSADGTLTPLPKPSVDTGMGLERIAAVMQGVHNNYETDLFMPIIRQCAALAGISDLSNQSLRVIADHLRATAFLIVDGVRPANEGRGYVLRRIMRRALRHGYQLGLPGSFFHTLLPSLIEVMGVPYSELITHEETIKQVMRSESEQFLRTLEQGMKLLDQTLAATKEKIIPGDMVFKLYDTYGFPVDLTADIARERGFALDEIGFEQAMQKQKNLSKSASKFSQGPALQLTEVTAFKGYEQLKHPARVTGLYRHGEPLQTWQADAAETIAVILDQTPFYAEAGGQVGDEGYLLFPGGQFKVTYTQKAGSAVAHLGVLESGELTLSTQVDAIVDEALRHATAINHSATHLLHSALKKVLGDHVQQKGSLVSAQRLRFDFSHAESLSAAQYDSIEQLVNAQIRDNHLIHTEIMAPDQAIAQGAQALFGEKYGDAVRVLSMGEFSKELCGGTHAARTGDIGLFKIIEETSIAAGIRRIEAVTGAAAIAVMQKNTAQLKEIAKLFKANPNDVFEKLTTHLATQKELEKQSRHTIITLTASHILASTQWKKDDAISIGFVDTDISAQALREIADYLKQGGHTKDKAVLLISTTLDEKINIVTMVCPSLVEKLKANEWLAAIMPIIDGKGGGNGQFAQATGVYDLAKKEQLEKQAKVFAEAKLNTAPTRSVVE